MDFDMARRHMVEQDLAGRGITNRRVLEAMQKVPRHLFVPPELHAHAYADHPLPIGEAQTISQPYMVALMTQLLDPQPDQRVLEIGTGSGYQAAILAELADQVVTVERYETLASAAAERFEQLGYDNITTIIGDGSLGWAPLGPYDAILVTAAAPDIPRSLKAQLKMGGRLVCPIGSRQVQSLCIVTRTADGFQRDYDSECVFVPLLGQEGWPQT